jgi:hypothetical protein
MKLYIASHTRHAKRWIKLRPQLYPKITVVSSWIDVLKDGEPNFTPEMVKKSWDNNIRDIILCDILMLYSEAGEPPRGAAFEAGIAFAMGKPILHVGDPAPLGSMHCCFEPFTTLEACFSLLADEQNAQDLINSNGSRAVN